MTRSLKRGSALFIASVAFATASASAAASAGIEMTPELKKIVQGARKEGALTVMTGATTMGARRGMLQAVAWIKKNFDVDLKATWSPGPPMAQQGTKIMTEYQAGQPSSTDAYSATAVQVVPLLKGGLFRTVDWVKLHPARIKPSMVEGKGTSLRTSTQTPGILYNKKALPGVANIHTMEDMLKPEWKGKLVTTAYLAAFDVLVSDEVWGFEKTKAFVARFAKQVGGILNCGAPDRIASGELPALAIDCSGGDSNRKTFREVLATKMLKDNGQRRYQYTTIPKNAAHPNAGILYTLYFTTKEGQDFLFEDRGNDMYDYPDSNTRKQIDALVKQGYVFRDLTVEWWSKQPELGKRMGQLIKILRENQK